MKMLNLFNTLLEFKKSKTKIVLILHFFLNQFLKISGLRLF